jgi:DNA-binding HxlR family transcriptional regulator
MEFGTGMENSTSKHFDEAECASCAPDPRVLAAFQKSVRAIAGKWKLEILFMLMDGAVRFGALRRSLGSITQHMLTTQLRELENDGLVLRTAFPGSQPHVEYELTEAAYGLLPVFRTLLNWSELYRCNGRNERAQSGR